MLYIVTYVSVDLSYRVHETHEPKVFALREYAEKYKENQEDDIYYGWIEIIIMVLMWLNHAIYLRILLN